ncbi:hypothetical protein CLU79DRAFT_769570 [Phycomyces nitens]|nr:hypothetical protein CLU79DRAFT_769570 [Phycomyces nitens]
MLPLLGCILLLLPLLITCNEKLVPFTDNNIKYFGRWRITTTDIQSGWPGAYLKTNVNGPTIKLRLNQPTTVYVQLGQEPMRKLEAIYKDRLPIELEVATDLSQGPHQLMVVSTANTSICLESLVLAVAATTAPPRLSFDLVEFVGHDLTLGIQTSQSLLTSFPWLVSTMMEIEKVQIAYPGAWLLDNPQALGMESQYFRWTPSLDETERNQWDFSSYLPSAVVILLGQNDPETDDYTHGLQGFLLRLRKHYAHCAILVLSEPRGHRVRQSQAAVHALNDGGDQDVYYIDTTDWVQDGSDFLDPAHLSDQGHERFARRLAPWLHTKLTWPRQPFPDPFPNPNLPRDWQTMDVGQEQSIGLPGSVSFDSGNTFTLWGSGTDIKDNQDAFRYVFQALSGDGSIQATIGSHSAFASCAKAGLMIREHLSLGSPHVMLGISPAEGLFLQTRHTNLSPSHLVRKTRGSPPYHFRITRKGNLVLAQISQTISNGWDTFANLTLPLARDVYVGLAVTSCDPSVVSVAKFGDVVLQGGVGSGTYGSNKNNIVVGEAIGSSKGQLIYQA